MSTSNRERIARSFEKLKEGLAPFAEREFREYLGGYWLEKLDTLVPRKLDRNEDGSIRWETQTLLKCMSMQWMEVFGRTLGRFERSMVEELREARNRWAHEETFTSDDTLRAIDTMQRLLKAISAQQQAEELEKIKVELQRSVFEQQARNQMRYTTTVEGQPQAGLKAWREIVTPHPDVASGRYLQAEFAADLAQVQRGEGSDEYRDPGEFFRRTFVTDGLHNLLAGALRRLAGVGGDPVVELQTNFGGGKTHSMLALYHLFGDVPSSQLAGLEPVLKEAEVRQAPMAHRAVLVGTALSPGEVSSKPDGTKVRTLWGEMAWQLGGNEGYQVVAESDVRGISPGSEMLAGLFRRFAPCLILIDEWVAYARQIVGKRDLPSGDFEAQATFAQALTEAAKAADRTLVVASIPASKIEIGGEHGGFALEALKNVFERLGAPWRPASADEGFEIVRRRLFEPLSEKEHFKARDAVVGAFAQMYRKGSSDFPSGCAEGSYRRKLEAAYPIHPELFDRLYGDWSTLDKFQRTRGVLRLLAKVVHKLWEGHDSGLLILPSSAPLDDGAVKSELTRYLDDIWEPIISEDVDGPNSLPLELDRSTPNLGRLSACRRVTRTLYLGTAPGARAKNPGVDDRRIRLGCAQPGEAAAIFGDALRRVSDRGKYIHQDGNRYWLSTQPNLNRMAEDRANEQLQQPEVLHEEIIGRLRQDKTRGDFAGVHICPASTGEIPDEMETRLVILAPTFPHRRNQPKSSALKQAQEILEQRGNAPRLNRNTLVFLAPDKQQLEGLLQAAAQYLAWRSLHDEEEALNLDAFQRRQAETRMKESNQAVDLRLKETWIHALVPTQLEATAPLSWDELRVTGHDPLAQRTASKLRLDELLLPAMGGVRLRMELDRYLWKDRDHIGLNQLAEYFARYLYLPRLVGRKTLEEAIQDGASQLMVDDTFAIASEYDERNGRYLGLSFGGNLKAVIESNTLLVKPKVALAQRQKEEEEQKARLATTTTTVPIPTAPLRTGDKGATAEPGQNATTTATNGVNRGEEAGAPEVAPWPKTFLASVQLDGNRIARHAGTITEEVIQHLSTLPGAEVEVTLEIQIRVPGGIKEDTVRTVSENCNTLKFSSYSFEKK